MLVRQDRVIERHEERLEMLTFWSRKITPSPYYRIGWNWNSDRLMSSIPKVPALSYPTILHLRHDFYRDQQSVFIRDVLFGELS